MGDLETVIGDVLDEFVPDLAEEMDGRVGIIDGTLCPCWSWADAPQLRSGKHKTTGHLHQLVCDLSGALLYVSDPLPGKTHDARAFAELGLSDILHDENSIGDKGYIGTGPTTPFRKPPGGQLLEWHKQFNTDISRIRYVIERTIANFKTWRCLFTDYRRPLSSYATAFRTVRALHFFKLRSA